MLKEQNEKKRILTSLKKPENNSTTQNKLIEQTVNNNIANINNMNNNPSINKNNKQKKVIFIDNNDKLSKRNQRSTSVPINIKSTKQFLSNFPDRYEIINKNNLNDIIMLSPQNKESNSLSKSYLPPLNHKTPSTLNKSCSDTSLNSEQSQKSTSYVNKIDKWQKHGKSARSYKKSSNYIRNHLQDNNMFQDRSYVPHSYKEYEQQMNEFKCNKFGGVGDNMGTLDWSKRFMRFQKMNLYGIRIVAEHLRNLRHNRLGPQEERRLELQKKYENSIRFKINKYGKEIMFNNLRELNKIKTQRQNESQENNNKKDNIIKEGEIITGNEEEIDLDKEQSEIRENTKETMESNRDEYLTKLNKLKESLIPDFKGNIYK